MSTIASLQQLQKAELYKTDRAVTETKKLKKEVKETSEDTETLETVRSQLNQELEDKDNALKSLVNGLRDRDVATQVTKALTDAECISPSLMARVVADRLSAEYDAEEQATKITVLDEDGKPLFVKGKEATVADLVMKMRDDKEYATLFAGIQQGGTGTSSAKNTAAKTMPTNVFESGDTMGKHKLANENPEEYRRQKAAYDKARGKGKYYHK